MSHKASRWVFELPADTVSNSEFRILCHLADCHTVQHGCFPSQAYLRAATGVSNGTLNNALKALERKGLIRRHRIWDKGSKRQLPTRYILGFELEEPQGPSPETGDGKTGGPSPETGDGAVSNSDPKPSPISGRSRLQPTGEVTCKEPRKNSAAGAEGPEKQPRDLVTIWADQVRMHSGFAANHVNPSMAREMLGRKLVTEDDLQSCGIRF